MFCEISLYCCRKQNSCKVSSECKRQKIIEKMRKLIAIPFSYIIFPPLP